MVARKTSNSRGAIVVLKTTLKLMATLLAMVLIGALVLVLNPSADIEPSQANIIATEFGPRSATARFADSLTALGHPEPLALELNGNRVFASTTHFRASPQKVVERYQTEFVRQNLNAREFTTLDAKTTLTRERAGFSGSVVPQKISPTHIIMSGADSRAKKWTPARIFGAFDPEAMPAKTFSAYRWVEIFQEPGSPTSTVLATWSDEVFDYTKMMPKSPAQAFSVVDPRVPVCPKCTLVNQLSDVGSPGTHLTYVFTTTHSAHQLETFYRTKLGEQGWKLAETHAILGALKDKFDTGLDGMEQLNFERDDWAFDLMIYPIDAKTRGVRAVVIDPLHQQNIAKNEMP